MSSSEGLERVNIDPGFLFSDGNVGEVSFASVNPSLGATGGAAFNLEAGLNVAPSFNTTTMNVKTSINDNIDIGLFYTSSGNGVLLDYGTIPAASPGASADVTIAADLDMPTLAGLAKYQINENMSVFGGIKRVTVPDGAFVKIAGDLTPEGTPFANGDPRASGTSHWVLGKKSETGTILGASYEMPDIALRVVLMIEEAIDLEIPTTTGGGLAANGTSLAGIGDAITLHFQTGIAEDTLLFGNIRNSKWEDNQVFVPNAAGTRTEISTFKDGTSYSLGLGRKINDDLSLSASAFYDSGDGTDASELAPTGSNTSLSLGGRYAVADNANLSLGVNYSQRGDATTSKIGAILNDSSVLSYGAKLSFNF
jgi:long-subunit fatty acid transport protein